MKHFDFCFTPETLAHAYSNSGVNQLPKMQFGFSPLCPVVIDMCVVPCPGAVIVFTGLLSVGFLGQKMRYFNWAGISLIIVGLVVVGVSDFFTDDLDNYTLNGIITGERMTTEIILQPQRGDLPLKRVTLFVNRMIGDTDIV